MIPISSSFIGSRDQRGWHFSLIKRSGMVAIFQKTKPPNPTPSYEVVILQTRPNKTWPNGQVTPAHESMPKPEDWGTLGWTTDNLERANEIYNREVERIHETS